jgi:hypothetical protein
VICPETEDAPAVTLHRPRSPSIGFDLEGVMVTIDFDDEFSGYTGKVGKVRPNGMLAAKLQATHASIPQEVPADLFRTTAVAAQLARSFDRVLHHPLT